MPKSGTTTLQSGVIMHLPQLASIGKSYAKNSRGKAWKAHLQRLTTEPSWGRAERSEAIAALNDSIADRPEAYWSGRTSIVLSFEGIFNTKGSVDPVERTTRLIDLLRGAGFEGDFRFLLTTREPFSFMESEYLNHFSDARSIPAMVDWVEERYERWDLFDYQAMKEGLGTIDDLCGVVFVPMDGLFRCEESIVEAASDALSLDGESRKQFRSLLARAPRVKERPDQIQFLCGRLRFELNKRRIPLGWLVVLV
jgi:hypothetical protein